MDEEIYRMEGIRKKLYELFLDVDDLCGLMHRKDAFLREEIEK